MFGPFRLQPEEGRLQRDGLLVPLTPKAFAMLLVLVSHSGRLVDKDVLMQELWPDAFVEEGNLTFTMSVLRKALDDSARAARYIETVPKRGYRFIAPVRESDVTNPVKSVAVLPFLNLGSADGSQYLAAGIQDALIDELARNGSLHVISRTSSMGATRPLAAFARALRLDAVVEGSALLDDRVHLEVSLTDPFDDQPLWTQSYERSLRDVASWQSEVARTIAQQIDAAPASRGYANLTGSRRRARGARGVPEGPLLLASVIHGISIPICDPAFPTGTRPRLRLCPGVGRISQLFFGDGRAGHVATRRRLVRGETRRETGPRT